MSRARRAARMEAQRLRGMGAQQEMVRQCRREVRDGPTMQTGGRRWQMLPQSTTLFIRMSPPPNSQEYLMDDLRSEAINRGACGPQGAASLPGEWEPLESLQTPRVKAMVNEFNQRKRARTA